MNYELKVVKSRLYGCVVKPGPQPDLLLPSVLAGLRVELQYIRTEVVVLLLYFIPVFHFVATIGLLPPNSPWKKAPGTKLVT